MIAIRVSPQGQLTDATSVDNCLAVLDIGIGISEVNFTVTLGTGLRVDTFVVRAATVVGCSVINFVNLVTFALVSSL